MFEYKVLKARNQGYAEEMMNDMAKAGWRVVSTTFGQFWGNFILITFEREK